MTLYEELKELVQEWRDESIATNYTSSFFDGSRIAKAKCANELEAALALPEDSIPPIDRDEEFDRTYIPLPGGWEVQTKGKGSTFRICDTKSGRRLAIPPSPYLHETLERMAREIHAAMVRPVNEDSKTANSGLYNAMRDMADAYAFRVIQDIWPVGAALNASKISASNYLELREASGEPMPYKVIRDGDKVRFE